jgi:uncharacterized protein with ParB-like and HNH nuclease domain
MEDRTTIFNERKGSLSKLFEDIHYGDLGLPELQRPFVWANNKVRNLFDSMYRGFPIGYFLFWENNNFNESKTTQIGHGEKSRKFPKSLIIDGQQRLTALYSVFKDIKVYDKTYKFRKIKISFNPISEEFKVSDASTAKNKEYIEDISTVFTQASYTFINGYIKSLSEYSKEVDKRKTAIVDKINECKKLNNKDIEFIASRFNQIKEVSEKQSIAVTKLKDKIVMDKLDETEIIQILNEHVEYDKDLIIKRIEKLSNLKSYPYQALEIAGDIDEEIVSEIFTRINSAGTILNQADFVLTLLSVFWDEGRKEIDEFCKNCRVPPDDSIRYSPYNHILEPDAQDIVRINVGIGFKRGRMKDAYAILKGRDLITRKFSVDLRDKQFNVFKIKQKLLLDNTNWHNFLRVLLSIGFKSKELISSKHVIISSYILFLIGQEEFKLDHKELEKYIGQWFFMSNLSSRYSSSPESQMEADLNKIKLCKNKIDFIGFITFSIENHFTDDFWKITMPNDLLITSSAIGPVGNTFFACLNKNNVNALFSNRKVTDLFDPTLKLRKKSLDRHHIFPANHLKKLQIEQTDRNQIANMTYLEFLDNIKISDDPPEKYFPEIKNRFFKDNLDELTNTMKAHCIPDDFYNMDYKNFLEKRRILIAKYIKQSFESI